MIEARRQAAMSLALHEYLTWTGDPVATLAAAVEGDPDFILGHTTIAALNSLGGVPGDAAPVRSAVAAAEKLVTAATPAQRRHVAASRAWADGEIETAANLWEAAVRADPKDLLALRLAHDTHFYLGDGGKLRDVPAAALPAYAHDDADRGFVLGMLAFGLQETGAYAEAEQAGRTAVATNPADAWAVHAVAHVLEMQDRPDEGLRWLRELEEHWVPAAGLAVHNWWHAGLFLIELGRFSEALELYDRHVRSSGMPAVLDLVDAAALLWRLELVGINVDQRWCQLAPLWRIHRDDHVLAFNDVHIAMTFAGAGEDAAADHLEEALGHYAATRTGTNVKISAALGLPVIRALRAFREGDFDRTVELLEPVYRTLAPIGGSNAQRDLFIQTLGIAASRTGRSDLARDVAAYRQTLKAGRPQAWKSLG